ncbi:MAG: hypothetical protein JSW45_03240 [Thiotrichales bacterium]|nr:MAG: hypothetical protein JSW45_03240 [Thiotrichales bacterium]
MDIVCYSERILNPFRGVMNVIALDDAEAVTTDGVNWSLYVRDQFDTAEDDPEEFTQIDNPHIRFGTWSEESGLKRAPVLPSYHYREIQHKGERLLEVVRHYAADVPFEFRDYYELWLLEQDTHQPLALIDSVCCDRDIYDNDLLTWRAGNLCRSQFRSEVANLADDSGTHADLLNRLINTRAGNRPSAQWFLREENGYGYGLKGINLGEHLVGREMSPRLFPRMFVEEHWENSTDAKLVSDFINWMSPWLLLLDFLKDPQRESLEQAARQHALLVDKLHRLYPKIVEEKHIKAARVEAMLRKTQQNNRQEQDGSHSSAYNTNHGWRTA